MNPLLCRDFNHPRRHTGDEPFDLAEMQHRCDELAVMLHQACEIIADRINIGNVLPPDLSSWWREQKEAYEKHVARVRIAGARKLSEEESAALGVEIDSMDRMRASNLQMS